jgi:uncharacterized protein YchJ
MELGSASTGITVHCNHDDIRVAGPRLEDYCKRRKYKQKVGSWFGICIAPDLGLRFGVSLRYEWQVDQQMENLTREMRGSRPINEVFSSHGAKKKVGRNDPCPCGSGLKNKGSS